MNNRDPEKNFEVLWETFNKRYPFFELRKVDWKKQYQIYRPKVTAKTSDDDLFDIFCRMLDPLDDGHVEVAGKANKHRKKRHFTPEKKPRFHREFAEREIKRLFKTTEKTLVANGFGEVAKTGAWMLRYCRSRKFGYIRILELEGVSKRKLTAALDMIARDLVADIDDNAFQVLVPAGRIVLRLRSSIAFVELEAQINILAIRDCRGNCQESRPLGHRLKCTHN